MRRPPSISGRPSTSRCVSLPIPILNINAVLGTSSFVLCKPIPGSSWSPYQSTKHQGQSSERTLEKRFSHGKIFLIRYLNIPRAAFNNGNRNTQSLNQETIVSHVDAQ